VLDGCIRSWQIAPRLTFAPPGRPTHYYRVELHGAVPDAPRDFASLYGDFISMSNPIYVSFP
jgi:hypothetical protein